MKAKTIQAVLKKKFKEWVESIEDESLQELVKKNTIITGGCIASMLLREPVSDFDVYFRDRATCIRVAEYYILKFKENPPPKFAKSDKKVEIFVDTDGDRIKIVVKSTGIASEDGGEGYRFFEMAPDPGSTDAADYVDQATEVIANADDKSKSKYRPVFLSSNAITLSDKVQLVIRFYGEPEQIHANFDFVHCTNYWTSWDGNLVLNQDALQSLLSKELRYVGSKYPLCSFIRTRKFIARGWTINAGQFLKMAMQLNQLDLKSLDVLEDQLVGVDAAYFIEVIAKLRGKNKDSVDETYLMEIIDQIF